MAFPLKSGADLYNQQLIRAAVWNYSAEILDPKEYATGLMYFNTNPGSNLYQKLRFRTGTEWKTIAFEEDLDVANNAEFKALEDKVELLSGEVDTDAIINNMKDVENFLKGFNESGGTLMNYLNTELGKKFDKSGGAINSSTTSTPLKILTSVSKYVALVMGTSEGNYGHFIYKGGSDWRVSNADWSVDYSLLHSGNVGEYNAGSADVIAKTYVGSINYAYYDNKVRLVREKASADWETNGFPGQYIGGLSAISDYCGWQMLTSGGPSINNPYFRKINDNNTWSEWKQIAFLDDNVASAQALVHSNGVVGATIRDNGIVSFNEFIVLKNNKFYMGTLNDGTTERNILGINSGNNLLVGYGSRWDSKTLIYGDGIECIIKDTPAFIINSSGNVTIGGSDLAGTSAKLYVDGGAAFVGGRVRIPVNGDRITFNADSGNTMGILAMNLNNTYLEAPLTDAGDKTPIFIGWRDGNYAITISKNGNVGIGTPGPRYKLHVGGDIVANGTIACKGIAAEGDAMDMVDKTVLYIIPNGTQQTFTLNHGLGTREIAISIYERTSMGWNMILTDVEIVDDNNISVSFGNPPTENHMVVVMG